MQDMKQSAWFIDLDKETQQIAIEQLKDFFTPPSELENTLLKILIANSNEWQDFVKKELPWADPNSNSIEVKFKRREFFKQLTLAKPVKSSY